MSFTVSKVSGGKFYVVCGIDVVVGGKIVNEYSERVFRSKREAEAAAYRSNECNKAGIAYYAERQAMRCTQAFDYLASRARRAANAQLGFDF